MRYLFSLLLGVLLVACRPTPSAEVTRHVTTDTLQLEVGGIQLGLTPPQGWCAYTQGESLVLSEYESIMSDDGALQGVLAHVWLPAVEDLAPDGPPPHNAQALLQAVVSAPHIIGNSVVTAPSPFRWSGHDAAYYLLNDGHGHIALVIMLIVPDAERLVALRVDAPIAHAQRARDLLPALFQHLVINGAPMASADLQNLPNPLPVPPYD